MKRFLYLTARRDMVFPSGGQDADRPAGIKTALLASGIHAALVGLLTIGPVIAQAAPVEEPLTGKQIIDNIVDFQKEARGKGRNSYCQINVSEEGVLRVMPGTNRLASTGAGARPGRAEILATHKSFKVHLDAPFGFRIAPPNGNNNVTFTASYSATGATSFSLVPGGISQKLKEGLTIIETHFVADRGNDPFPAGQYQAELVLRCE